MKKNTILTAHQSAYMPWIGLFHKILLADIYIYLDNVQFEKNSYSNRNKIKTSRGAHWLTVPIKLKGHLTKKIKDIEIDNSKDWRKDHWKAIFFSYRKAKYFAKYADFFADTYKKDWPYLSSLNEYILKWFLNELGIKTKFYKSSDIKVEGNKSDLILAFCEKFDANLYIFGSLGRNYADKRIFAEKNIAIYFQDYTHPSYPQLHGAFESNLGACDLLFNCGSRSLQVLESSNVNKKFLIQSLL